MTLRDITDRKLPEGRHLTRSHLQVVVEGLQLRVLVRLSSYRVVARRRWQSHDRKWCHVTSRDRKWRDL